MTYDFDPFLEHLRSAVSPLSILCVAMLAPIEPAARAQSSVVRTAAFDSLDLIHRARQAQRKFERIRRANLHRDFDGGSGPCDERIGRFCYWYQPLLEPPPSELKQVGRARERLLGDLAAAGGQLPGDGWIIGQRVRYLAEHGRADSAVLVAQRCRATPWWCEALTGFARHVARDYPAADDAFARALRLMDEEQRCAWTDLSLLLGDGVRRYRALPCSERQRVNERIWWLARPLYSQPGNDLRTEHYARHTMALLLEDAETADGVRSGADSRELIVRFGWPTHWSRPFDRPASLEPSPVLGYEPSPSFWFLPTPALAKPGDDVTQLRWDPWMERPPARYAPPYAAGFAPIAQVQFARFLRGDTTLTVAAFDLTLDSIFANHPVDLRLAVAKDPATPVIIGPPRPGSHGVVSVRSRWRPAVLSLEGMGRGTPWVARWRVMAPPDPAGVPPILSDILLFVPQEMLPESLDGVLPVVLRAAVLRAGQQVGLYWEMYDASDSTALVEFAVAVTKAHSRGKVPYPVGRAECPPRFGSPVAVRWREEPDSPRRGMGRAIVLDLRPLSRGRYVVSVQTSVAGELRGCSSREFRVVKR